MPDLTGQNIGKYHIIERLGEGGMAIVYRAFDTNLESDVAIKVIRTDLFGSSVLERILKRFEREAKALAKLNHPNIVSVLDYGDFNDSPYLVMKYMPGGTLKQWLGKPVPYPQAARLLAPIARALAYAHQHGILHRDVKPSNILLTDSGEPMLTDFGIAKIMEESESHTLTGTGVGLGTPEYMAPEQWHGKSEARSDQYSLGVVFYELITGQKPYTADTPAAIAIKQATDPLPRPRHFVPNLPEPVERILFKVLAKNPEDRYREMFEFAEVLERLGGDQFQQHRSTKTPTGTQPEKSSIPAIQSTDEEKTIDLPGGKTSSIRNGSSNKKPKTPSHQFPGWGWGIISVVVLGLLFTGISSLLKPGPFFPDASTTPEVAVQTTEAPIKVNQTEVFLPTPSEAPSGTPSESPTITPTHIPTAKPTPSITFSGTLHIWADETRSPILQDLAAAFKEKYGVELVVELRSTIRDDFKTAAPTGDGPDIIVIAHDQAGTLVSYGLLAPIDLGDKASQFVENAKQACTFDGVLYCMPYATENLGFFYNTDMLPRPPTTWDEVVIMGEELKAVGKVDYIMALPGTTYDLYPLFTSFGGYIFGKDDRDNWKPQNLGVDSPGMIAAATWLKDNIANGNLPTDINWANNHALFETGKVPFIMAGPWALDSIRQSGVKYAVTNFPAGPAGEGYPFAGTQGFFINAQSENIMLANAFLTEFVATDEVMQKLYETGKRPSAFIPVLEKTDDADLKAMAAAGENATMMPAIPEMASVWGNWADAITLVIQGDQEPEVALKDAATKIRSMISGSKAGMVNVPGSYQVKVSCTADWAPDCDATAMTKGNDSLWRSGPFKLPAGLYEFKVAMDGAWTINYGMEGKQDGDNFKVTLAASGSISFVYNPATHILTWTVK